MAATLADNNLKYIFLNEKDKILIRFSLKFVPRSPIDNMPALAQESNWQYASIGSGNGLAPNRRQAITWPNADPVHWHMYAALGGDELNHYWSNGTDKLLHSSYPEDDYMDVIIYPYSNLR